MKNPIQAIVDFNIKAGFLDKQNPKPFNDLGESSYLIEEALEPYNVDYIASLFQVDKTSAKYEKNPQREVAKAIVANTLPKSDFIETVQYVDKYLDAIVYAVGSLAKIGLSHQQITAGLNIVTEANLKKTINPQYDDQGKLLKPEGWEKYDPEIRLKHLLKDLHE